MLVPPPTTVTSLCEVTVRQLWGPRWHPPWPARRHPLTGPAAAIGCLPLQATSGVIGDPTLVPALAGLGPLG